MFFSMLLVGDTHLNSKYSSKIIDKLEKFILNHDEKNIIFLGDYVYHFVYDRRSLLNFLNLLLRLSNNGKNIYVLAGNHDWIQESFVFQEAYMFLKSIKNFNLYFILEPEIFEIEGEKVLFLPYNLSLNWQDIFKKFNLDIFSESIFDQLLQSKNFNEVYSGYLNKFLYKFFEKNKDVKFLIHHFYTEGQKFPGQGSKFSFKDIAIHNSFLNYNDIVIISGHLHQAFVYKNYLCTGSVWATSPLEKNQFKFLFSYKDGYIKVYPFFINFYLEIFLDEGENIDKNFIENQLKNHYINATSLFKEGSFGFNIGELNISDIDLKDVSLTVVGETINYDNLKDFVSEELSNLLKEIKIKKKLITQEKISDLLNQGVDDLQNSISNWFDLLKKYVKKKYPDNYKEYFEILDEVMK